jgi:flavin reductase (DIM6/NTAB) family NADH-FMN oxidoreductase RutF
MSTPQVSETKTVTFDFETLSARDRYKLLIGTIVPRPIALVTTIDQQGRVNAAPFSFFNCLSADPPILALGIENHPDMSFKDTTLNIRLNEEFTVNIVSHAIAEAMHVCAVPFAPERDELLEAGLTAMPGKRVASPWIKEAPAAFECRRHLTLEVGKSRQIILGEIIFAHYREDVVDMNLLHVETAAARTLRRDTASNGLIAVRRAARQSKSVRFTALLHHVTIDLLKQSYLSLERDSAPGIDDVTWQAYGENLEEN